ncbi:hypothetical protein K435DRAFT_675206 [Dendrothele bispora CBS 962.96]|uniref:G domain-containing protein n=1 Tax=Dendrothele bispora (strain CBS 962.96) TaxID=1314807 RepID=A0A4S8LNG0_DENBC|nr:hypothetical protein K435DRAFT_675206 [Dendrothele bispora CBS 962.96]
MATEPPDSLPSRVKETLDVWWANSQCLYWTGVGKSSLVSTMFNINLKDIDIAHDRAGRADIARPYTSPENPRFILHDSKGFEPGSGDTWGTVDKFIQDRCGAERSLKERVHTIW